MWCDCREAGKLVMSDAETLMFCDSFQEHAQRKGTARLVDMWLATNRPVLQLCKQRAAVRIGSSVTEDEVGAISDTEVEPPGTMPEDTEGINQTADK